MKKTNFGLVKLWSKKVVTLSSVKGLCSYAPEGSSNVGEERGELNLTGATITSLDESVAGRPFAIEVAPVGDPATIFAAGSIAEMREWIDAFKAAAAQPAGIMPPVPPAPASKRSPSKAIEDPDSDDPSPPIIATVSATAKLASPRVQLIHSISLPDGGVLIPVGSSNEGISRTNSVSPLERSPSSAFMSRSNIFFRSPSGTPLNISGSAAKDSPVDLLTKGISNDSIDGKDSPSATNQEAVLSPANDTDVKLDKTAIASPGEVSSATSKKYGAASKKGLSKLFSFAVDESELNSKLISQLAHQGEDPKMQLKRQFSSGETLGKDGKFWTESAASDLGKHKISRRKLIYECRSLRQKIVSFEVEFQKRHHHLPEGEERAPFQQTYDKYKRLKKDIRRSAAVDIQRVARRFLARLTMKRAREISAATSTPPRSDLEVLLQRAQQKKKSIKKILRNFEENFVAEHSRAPSIADKEAMRAYYDDYSKVKKEIDQLKVDVFGAAKQREVSNEGAIFSIGLTGQHSNSFDA